MTIDNVNSAIIAKRGHYNRGSRSVKRTERGWPRKFYARKNALQSVIELWDRYRCFRKFTSFSNLSQGSRLLYSLTDLYSSFLVGDTLSPQPHRILPPMLGYA